MSEKDVEEAIIGPMTAVYPTPQHLRGSSVAARLALDTYRRGLARYDRPTLLQAWQRAAERNEFWTWPKLADFVRACEEVKEQAGRGAVKPPDDRPERAAQLAAEYTSRFMSRSRLAERAVADGWAERLNVYVAEAAWVQAQMIAGCSPVGYSAVVLGGYEKLSREEQSERLQEFLSRCREQAEKGHIRVHVPHAITEWCRRQPTSGRRQGAGG